MFINHNWSCCWPRTGNGIDVGWPRPGYEIDVFIVVTAGSWKATHGIWSRVDTSCSEKWCVEDRRWRGSLHTQLSDADGTADDHVYAVVSIHMCQSQAADVTYLLSPTVCLRQDLVFNVRVRKQNINSLREDM